MTLIFENNILYIKKEIDWYYELQSFAISINRNNFLDCLDNICIRLFYESYQTNELCKSVLNNCGKMILFVKNPTHELYDIAFKENWRVIIYINDDEYIKNIPNYEELFNELITEVHNNLLHIKKEFQTYKILKNYIINHIQKLAPRKETNEEYENRKCNRYSYIKNFDDVKICDLIAKQDPELCYKVIKNVNYLIKNELVDIKSQELDDCPVCGDLKQYYMYYDCNETNIHMICCDCSTNNKTCYYKCNVKRNYTKCFDDYAELIYDTIIINTNFKV